MLVVMLPLPVWEIMKLIMDAFFAGVPSKTEGIAWVLSSRIKTGSKLTKLW